MLKLRLEPGPRVGEYDGRVVARALKAAREDCATVMFRFNGLNHEVYPTDTAEDALHRLRTQRRATPCRREPLCGRRG